MKKLILLICLIIAVMPLAAFAAARFPGWNSLINYSSGIAVVRCENPEERYLGDTLIQAKVSIVEVLKGQITLNSVMLKTPVLMHQGEYYLVFSYTWDDAPFADDYQVVHLGTHYEKNMAMGKSLDERVHSLLKRSLGLLTRQMEQEQKEKQRLERGAGVEQADNQTIATQLQRLEKLSDQERAALLKDNDQYLRQTQDTLLSHLGSADEDVKFYAAYLLGAYRFPQAVSSLANNIALEDKIRSQIQKQREWYWDIYPAMEALIRIGNPAIPTMIRNLEESDNANVRELSLRVVYSIDRDKDMVRLRLQKAAEAQKDLQKKARLQSALKALEKNTLWK